MSGSVLGLNSGFGIFIGLLFVLLFASSMTMLLSWLLLNRYKKSVGKLMQACGSPTLAAPNLNPIAADEAQAPCVADMPALARSAERVYQQMIGRPWHCAAKYAMAGGLFALIMAIAFGLAFSQTQINPLRAADHPLQFVLIGWIFAWPALVSTFLIAKPSWQHKIALVCGYFAVLIIFSTLITLIPTEAASRWGKGTPAWSGETPLRVGARWLSFNLLPTLLLIVFRNRRLRAVAPLVLAFMTAIAAGLLSMLLWLLIDKQHFQALSGFIAAGFGLDTDAAFMVALGSVTLASCSVFAGLGGWLLLKIRQGYLAKSISDQSLSLDAVWLLYAAFYAMLLALAGPGWAIFGLIAFLAYKFALHLSFKLSFSRQADIQYCPVLLVLRVFSLGKRSESLFDAVAAQWRYIGTIQLIAGTDLAQSIVAPHQFLSFISGKLKGLFIDSEAAVSRSIQAIDRRPDADGRFRINDFLCYQNTWQSVLSKLVFGKPAVLMDLRNFQPENEGCIFELKQLLHTVPAQRLVLIVDSTTNRAALQKTLQNTCAGLPVDSPNVGVSADSLPLFELKYGGAKELQRLCWRLCEAAGDSAVVL